MAVTIGLKWVSAKPPVTGDVGVRAGATADPAPKVDWRAMYKNDVSESNTG